VGVMISGGPCDISGIDKILPAIVQGWWNGLEGGNALADILYGNIAPSGKLPFTFPVKLADSPAYALDNYPQKAEVDGDLFGNLYRQDVQGQRRRGPVRYPATAYYSEGPLVGYRWYDTKSVPVMYAFGHGLSYVNFTYADMKANKSSYGEKDIIKVRFKLSNTGDMPAEEVAQLYVHRLDGSVSWPVKELKAFRRVSLAAGETKTVTLEIPVSELRYWDEQANGWALESGSIELLLGGASDDIRLSTTVKI
jgi:beta-glucosidase